MFKIIKKCKKSGILGAGPRGCEVARKATWLCQVDMRACLRGEDVTWTRIYNYYIYLFYKVYRSSDYWKTDY